MLEKPKTENGSELGGVEDEILSGSKELRRSKDRVADWSLRGKVGRNSQGDMEQKESRNYEDECYC
jgi:hypothetical protein